MAPQHPTPPAEDPLAGFAPATRAWFTGAFPAPTTAQAEAWRAIGRETDVLVVAPTGSGKTLAAFLSALDRLSSTPPPAEPKRRCRVLYVSPLKALAVDVERNLRAPLTGLRQAAVRLGLPEPEVQVAIRSGDTPAADRRRFATHPPDILITTPESLFLLLTSASREALRGVDTVILDEVHAVAGTKRGAHLALSLERLDELLDRPARRIGLSATVRPVEEVARFLSPQRGAVVVQPAAAKEFDLSVVVPVPDLDDLPAAPAAGGSAGSDPQRQASIWPHVEERIVDLVEAHRSTIVFANSRRLAERLCNRLNEIAFERATGAAVPEAHAPAELMGGSGAAKGAPPVIARAHHGSVSKEQRSLVEEELKAGRLPAVVATSSLELGIDMGAVELVVQVESPPSVASGLQRVGRAGHQVGAVSTGIFFPKYRGDLVQSAVVTERMRAGRIEALRIPRNPLDVLAQQLVAMTALDDWPVDDLIAVVRRAAPFATLPQSAFDAVLDMLAGRYPSDAFAELRPRVVWDRVAGTVTGRPGAQRLAVTSGGTIPDRGLFGVFIAGSTESDSTTGKKGGGGRRVGELDEEMVYESRVGDVFTLGTTSWRIEEITHDKVLVTPAPGVPGRLPFWKGDTLGRPLELGRALGAFTRELGGMRPDAATERLKQAGLDDWAAANLLDYLAQQRAACGHLPDDRTIVVERFRDELGDWRIVIHSPFGAQVHAPWALALGARLREKHGLDPQVMHADDGIVLRLPDADLLAPDFDFGSPSGFGGPSDPAGSAPDEAPVGADATLFDPGEIEQLVTDQVGGSALFASRFRECAGRALLLPRRSPGRRTPLWQQRQRAAQLLEVASEYGSFPIVLEAVRECLQDVFDVPGLVELMGDLESRAVRLVEVTTPEPSPFARSLLFGYVAQFLYEGDSPLAERRAAALSLDSRLLSELLGQAELSELLDPQVLTDLEAELQRLTPERRIRDAEGVADALRLLGPLTEAELTARGAEPLWALELEAARRVIQVRIAGEQRWAAIEDAGRLRDALGTPLPVGVPEAFTEPVKDPLGDLLARHARTHGPFTAAEAGARYGLGTAVVTGTLHRLTAAGRLVQGQFTPPVARHHPSPEALRAAPPDHAAPEWCDAEVLRRLRRRSLAALRQEVEPVPPRALAAFLPQWQHLAGHRLRGPDGLLRVVEQLQGTALPASALEKLILPARLADYSPGLLDELTAAGEIGWCGAGALPGKDGWLSLHLTENAHLLRPEPVPPALTPVHTALMQALAGGYGLFFRQLVQQLPEETPEPEVVEALWDLVWAGYVTNDTLAPLRALLGSGRTAGATAHRAPRATPRGRYGGAGRPFGRPGGALRSGPPTVAGRWSLLPAFAADPTVRATAQAQSLLDRHGLLTRGTVAAERVPGGFAGVYRVLAAMEERGRARRGYFVEGLGGAQFAMEGAADRLRSVNGRLERARGTEWPAAPAAEPPQLLVLAAADPANAYGAALPWPEPPTTPGAKESRAHRPGRKAGALVVLVDGELALYVERGGKSLLAWPEDAATRALAAGALAEAVRAGALGSVTVERANGEPALGSELGRTLEEAGFHATPRGLRLRP
ncbi:DEAD/DEAH box helicase [Kitasatospora sp. SUK 42]|uniref:DEAD/DEAH box helicase n=1 Tax=Kitasatospora sp. SUK 42 TaxID=1588882 RepID=UPI0018CB40BF|nr:DEAD/DEAH box helicase [Kitasatospora sp. SUK 42]MBV2151692.1 DEAD/DEAH box helicase [Kitasatospora sp. SUK 42]